MNIYKLVVLLLVTQAWYFTTGAQEMVAPLTENIILQQQQAPKKSNTAARPTALSLPFFEDFTGSSVYPEPSRWTDQLVYINNNMAVNPPSRGVATFDALNGKGVPYDTLLPYHQVFADSLTSQVLDLSSYAASDSIYFSFFYEPKGYGFAPKTTDSLMLFFHTAGGSWNLVWSAAGDSGLYFRQVMIPITATDYFFENFDFRFVNKATHGISNSEWHLDYIRIDEGRTLFDTTINDLAFTTQPYSLLNDFTAMPYKHFATDPTAFIADNHNAYIKNNGNTDATANYGYVSQETSTGTGLGSGTGSVLVPARTTNTLSFPMVDISSFSPADPDGGFVFEQKYYCAPAFTGEPSDNDTITSRQVFDNYFAYDDGTAEQSYFLNLAPAAPGKIAIEYALYTPDTITGVAIRFVRQVPSAANKDFTLAIYKEINDGVDMDDIVYQEELFFPAYEDSVNHLSYFRFEQPVAMDAGIFYVGVIQPAGGISDSLSIAIDRNRIGGNHRYYNVGATWEPSLIDGALLVRPILGTSFLTSIDDLSTEKIAWDIYPNPARELLNIALEPELMPNASYQVYDLSGRMISGGPLTLDKQLNIASLVPGLYMLHIQTTKGRLAPKKFVKM